MTILKLKQDLCLENLLVRCHPLKASNPVAYPFASINTNYGPLAVPSVRFIATNTTGYAAILV